MLKILSLAFGNHSIYSYEWSPSCVKTCKKDLLLTNCNWIPTDRLPLSFSLPSLCSQPPWDWLWWWSLQWSCSHSASLPLLPLSRLSCLVLDCQSVRGHITEQIKQQGRQKSGPGKSRSDKVPRLASAVHLTFPAWDLLVGSLPKRFHFKQSCQRFRQGTESPTETPVKEPEFLELWSFPPDSLTFPAPVSAMGYALFPSDSTEAVLSHSCRQNCVMSVCLSLGFKESLAGHYSSEVNKFMVPPFFPTGMRGHGLFVIL